MSLVREIPVKDANGDELMLYEFEHRRFLAKIRRFKLSTGELVEVNCKESFVIPATGERLSRIR